MYQYFEGKLTEVTPTFAVIDCGGVGYYLNISLNTFARIQKLTSAKLWAHHVVREDAQLLFGFSDFNEREMFRKLIAVSGIGANTARLILSSLTPEELRHAILSANVEMIRKIKGIGEKTAQRLIVELKDKVEGMPTGVTPALFAGRGKKQEVVSALVSLGFIKSQAERAVEKVISSSDHESTIEELIKLCLKIL
ncbi:MAG: Holliday junction branch migration protein RuvA [Bacteroidetes bacterium]|nr:Holliday junction branch migration protein RuvA [Bacteroidota bacterium]MBU1719919.1 Holliday junction branch migration protein RuvA [Bacteroidota bacterium]